MKGIETDIIIDKLPKLIDLAFDGSGHLLTATKEDIREYDDSGELHGIIHTGDFPVGDLLCLQDGGVIARANRRKAEGDMSMLVDIENGKLAKTSKNIGNYSERYTDTYSGFGGDYDLFILQSNSYNNVESGVLVCGLNIENGNTTPVFDLAGTNAKGTICALYKADGQFILLAETDDGQASLLRMEKTKDRKTVLTIGRMENNIYVSQAIIDFNSISGKYYAISKGYYGEDPETQLNLEIASGKQPDIISLLNASYEVYASKAAFVDMYAFMDDDPDRISREDLLPSVLRSLEWPDGALYRICPTFAISSCCVLKEIVGDTDSWNLDDMYRICREYPDITLRGNQGGNLLIDYLISDVISYFCDIEKNDFRFNDEEFIDFLMFLKEMNDRAEKFSWDDNDFVEKRVLLEPLTILTMDDWKTIVQGNYYDLSDVRITGFPSQTGTGCHINIPISFSIFKGTGNENAAWEFIEILLSEEYQSQTAFLPVLTTEMDERITEAMETSPEHEETVYADQAGAAAGTNMETYTILVPERTGLTKEEADAFRVLLDKSDTVYQDTHLNTYLRFISDETKAFFAGDKSAEDTAEIIQNKMEIYFSEHK